MIMLNNKRNDADKVSADNEDHLPTYEEKQSYLKTMHEKLAFIWHNFNNKKPLNININDLNFTIEVKACEEVYGYDIVSGNYILGLRLIINDEVALTIYKTTYASGNYSPDKHRYIDFYSKYVDDDVYNILNTAYDAAVNTPTRERLL
jgi:hypothetical protein